MRSRRLPPQRTTDAAQTSFRLPPEPLPEMCTGGAVMSPPVPSEPAPLLARELCRIRGDDLDRNLVCACSKVCFDSCAHRIGPAPGDECVHQPVAAAVLDVGAVESDSHPVVGVIR